MAKNRRSNANDTGTSSPPQPRAGRRMTSRQQASGQPEPEPGSRQGDPQEMPNTLVAKDAPAAPDALVGQGFSPAQYQSTAPEPSEHEIRLRAYLKYLDRGAWDGADFDDWLQAEMELKKR